MLLMNLARKIRRLRALSGKQRLYGIVAWLALPIIWLVLRTVGLARMRSWLDRSPQPKAAGPAEVALARELGDAVNIAANHTPFPATCLSRSLLLQCLLRAHGVASDLRIGVKLSDGRLHAHAWTECDGVPVNDAADVAGQFSTFDTLVPLSAFVDVRHVTAPAL